jgi:uncharacterized membrane protein
MSTGTPLGAARSGTFPLGSEPLVLGGSRSRVGQFALGGVLLTGVILATCAARTDLLLPESVRPVPRWLAGPFGAVGVHLGTAALMIVLVAMFGAYALAVSRAERLSTRAVLGTIAALHALVLLAPPLLSTDVFSYQAYARMFALYGANPYTHGPSAIALDPVYPFVGAKWVTIPTAYGPLFTGLSALLAPLSIAAAVMSYKAVAALASLALIALVWNVARQRGLDPVKAVALVGLNPLVVVFGVGGGHNDLLMLAVMMLGLSLVLQRRERSGGVAMAAAVAIKLTGGLLAPFALAGMGAANARPRRREFLLGLGVTTVAVAALTFGLFGTGSLHMLSTLHTSQSEGDWSSIPGFITTKLGLGMIGHLTGYLLGVAFLGVCAWLLRRVWRGDLDWIDGAAWATTAILLTASSLLPWYAAWLVPLAALGRDRRLVRTSLIMSAVVLFIQLIGYIPHPGAPWL